MEKYGEIPKRFTKAWWQYFWFYYKWHTLFTAFTVLVITITCVECSMRPNYDVTMTYAGDVYYEDAILDNITNELAQEIIDINDDNKNLVSMQQITVPKDGTPQAGSEYASGMLTKLSMEFQAGDTYLFLFNRQELDRLLNRNSTEQLFVKTDEWANSDIDTALLAKKLGTSYAISLKGNKYFENHRFVTDDLYIVIRCLRPRDIDNKKEVAAYNESIKIANYILDYH